MKSIFFISIISSAIFLAGCKPKTKISEEQWKGYSKCLNQGDKDNQIFQTAKCKLKFNIPCDSEDCKRMKQYF